MADTQKVWKAIEGVVSKFDCTLSRTGDIITIDCTPLEKTIKKSESEIKRGKARILNKKEFKKRYGLK